MGDEEGFMNYPLTLEERVARREELRQNLLHQAEENAKVLQRSMKCSGRGMPYGKAVHLGEPDGCKNSGDSCLCECHDPK